MIYHWGYWGSMKNEFPPALLWILEAFLNGRGCVCVFVLASGYIHSLEVGPGWSRSVALYMIYVIRSFFVLQGIPFSCEHLRDNRGWGVWFCFAAVLARCYVEVCQRLGVHPRTQLALASAKLMAVLWVFFLVGPDRLEQNSCRTIGMLPQICWRLAPTCIASTALLILSS